MIRWLLLLCLWPALSQAGTVYYLDCKDGSNANTGLSWAQAWQTCGKIDSTIVAGDTVVFAENDTCYDCSIDWPEHNANRDWTLFSDSAFFANKNGAHYSTYGPGPGAPVLYAGHDPKDEAADQENAWVQHSGNVYKAEWDEKCYVWPSGTTSTVHNGIQNHDSMMLPVTSLANVNGAGEFYYDDGLDTVYAWKYGGGDPDGTPMIFSRAAVFHTQKDESTTKGWGTAPGTCCATAYAPVDCIRVTGLDIRGGNPGTIFFHEDPMPDTTIVQHCHLSRGSNNAGENPSPYHSMNWTSGTGYHNVLRACSLGWAVAEGDGSAFNDMFSHGSNVTIYAQQYFHVDSCYFYGFGQGGLDFKCDGITVREFRGNKCTYSIFNPAPSSPPWGRYAFRFSTRQESDSIYGCIFDGANSSVRFQAISTHVGNNYNESCFVGNNTFYDVGDYVFVTDQDADSCRGGHRIMYNAIHNFRPGSGADGNEVAGFYWSSSGDDCDSACMANWGVVDSNAYYDAVNGFLWDQGKVGDNRTLTQWRGSPPYPDSHSFVSSTQALLVDPASGDYSPTADMPTMSLEYGGRTWTKYGAIQEEPSEEPPTLAPLPKTKRKGP